MIDFRSINYKILFVALVAASGVMLGFANFAQAAHQSKYHWEPYSAFLASDNCAPSTAAASCCHSGTDAGGAVSQSFLGRLGMVFDTTDFPPRWRCGTWSAWLGWLHIVSDMAIFLAYVAIPAALIYFIRKRNDVPFSGIFFLFGAFIICCGITHLMEAIIFYWPAYRLAGFLKLITALVSVTTVIALLPIVPKALMLKTPAQLQTTVDERTKDLSVANQKLNRTVAQLDAARHVAETATRAKSEFLANMSHEIRTPMTAILGFTDLMLEGGPASPSSTDTQDAARTIKRNGEHLLAVLNDILDLSKIEAGKLEIEAVTCCLPELVDDVVNLMSAKASAAGLTLDCDLADDLPQWVAVDVTRLKQILANLVGNAIKFTADGRVTLQVGCVESSGDESERKLAFDVIDTGVGMSAEQAARIFDSFGQADASTTRKFGGTGLGLTISRELAHHLGGELRLVHSEPGKGSQFRVTISVRLVAPPTASSGNTKRPTTSKKGQAVSRAHDAKEPLRGARLLVAEDGIDNQRLLRVILKKAGAEVQFVENGQLALEAIRVATVDGQPPHLVLMDMQMPVMDGYQATQSLRESGFAQPIIALTAHAMKDDRQRCLDAGCDDYLTKPINRSELVGRIAQHLERVELNTA